MLNPTPLLQNASDIAPALARCDTQRPAPGRNHFMMAHGGIFWEATGFTVQEGHAVVMDPGNLKVIVARVSLQQ